MAHILVVDDLLNVRKMLAMQLSETGHQVVEADGGQAALDLIEKGVYDLVITDLRMGAVDGLTVLRAVKKASPSTEVIVMTAYGTVESGVAAMKAGAHDYLTKPVQATEMNIILEQALEKRRLNERLQRLQEADGDACHVGISPAFQAVLSQVAKVAPTDATVLLTGESGVGKEIVANLLHAGSRRKDAAMLKINLGAISETLQESELFGHVKGSFTGAVAARKGVFMESDGATLFMDEVGEAALSTQVKLLRVLAQGEVRPVGGDRDVKIDVRTIVATNANLEEAVGAGTFREDLFFRIKVFPIEIPALRDRVEDIPGLAEHLMARHCVKLNRPQAVLTADARDALCSYPWPGNVRELENVLERTLILVGGDSISAADLPLSEGSAFLTAGRRAEGRIRPLAELEREHILDALKRSEGQKGKAAAALGIARATLFRKLREYGVS